MKRLGLLFLFFTFNLILEIAEVRAEDWPFKDVTINNPFKKILSENQDIMAEQGAWILSDENDSKAIVGIGKVIVVDSSKMDSYSLVRKGEMKARAAIIELGGEVEISVKKGSIDSKEKASLTSFYQTTESKVEGHVKSIPVVGSWWSKDKGIFYVALGEFDQQPTESVNHGQKTNSPLPENLDGKEPYITLLKLNPDLCTNGGARGFILEDGTKIIMAVSSAKIGSSPVKSKKIARLRAIRLLLESKGGIKVLSVEKLIDREELIITNKEAQFKILSDFLSVKKEQVSGFIKGLPVVGAWHDSNAVYVAIGTKQEK